MKRLVVTFIFLSSAIAHACLGKAQITAPVATTQKTLMSCVAYVEQSRIRHYQENPSCPMDLEFVVAQGIEVGLINGHDCALEVGDILSGVVVQNASGALVLE